MGCLGPMLTRREPQGWAYGLKLRADHLNQAGVAHGGTLTTLLDQALSAIAWQQSNKQPCVTLQLNTSFLQAARLHQQLIARGSITHTTGALLFMTGTLHADDQLIATAQAIMKRLKA